VALPTWVPIVLWFPALVPFKPLGIFPLSVVTFSRVKVSSDLPYLGPLLPPGASQLKIVGSNPTVFVNNTVHLLKQSGSISLKDLPGSLDLGLVRYDGANLVAPTGPYGTSLIHP